ncbi:MAG: hypothetical protein M3N98_02475, partial [Actinomycetota bacterium]|nr:hypothetical protein [Actinomycetota bacterium]
MGIDESVAQLRATLAALQAENARLDAEAEQQRLASRVVQARIERLAAGLSLPEAEPAATPPPIPRPQTLTGNAEGAGGLSRRRLLQF